MDDIFVPSLLDSSLEQAYYIQQAQNGLYAREAIFCHCLGISLDDVKNDKSIIE